MWHQWVAISCSSDMVRCSLQRFSSSIHQAHFALSYTIRQRQLVDFSATCNLFCRADIPRPGARVCSYNCLQPKTPCLSPREQVVFRTNARHCSRHSKQGTHSLPKPPLVQDIKNQWITVVLHEYNHLLYEHNTSPSDCAILTFWRPELNDIGHI